MNSNNTPNNAERDEITIKDLIFKFQEYFSEILQNWNLVIFIIIPFLAYFFFKAITTPVKYPTELTFMVNEDEGGGVGGAMAILSQFGFGGGGNSGKYNLEKILQLSKSRKIIQNALFKKTTLHDNEDFIANHLIDLYNFHEVWEDSEVGLKDFKFKHNDLESFDLIENTALKTLYGKVIGGENVEGLFSTGINEETGIMTFRVKSKAAQFSIDLLKSVYDNLSTFYTLKTVEKQKATYDLVKAKVDSIHNELNEKEIILAKIKDSSRNIYTNTDNLREARISRNVKVLNVMYAESIKNLEIADFSLKNKTPFIQLIDEPILPISAVGESKLKAIIYGGLLGGILAVGFIIGRKTFQDIMEENDE